jgi:hypothetical protein
MKSPQYIEIDEEGNKFYYSDKEMTIWHREDGAAIEWNNGNKEWWLNGKTHREDGPAIEYLNGDKYWYRNGKYHREDGPSVERKNGVNEWWQNGIFKYNKIKFDQEVNDSKKININGKEFTIEELNSLIASKEKS